MLSKLYQILSSLEQYIVKFIRGARFTLQVTENFDETIK